MSLVLLTDGQTVFGLRSGGAALVLKMLQSSSVRSGLVQRSAFPFALFTFSVLFSVGRKTHEMEVDFPYGLKIELHSDIIANVCRGETNPGQDCKNMEK